jgi:hypothetical protein
VTEGLVLLVAWLELFLFVAVIGWFVLRKRRA